MNPLTNVRNQNKINQRELELGLTNKKSWHDKYKDSAWIFIGGLPYDLTEGDVLCIFSQYGEIVNINLVRDQKSGKSKGFCFVCYEDQRSTILAVDNFNGAKVLGRIMRVDHVEEYKKPKEHGDEDDITMKLRADGCAPKIASSPEPEEELDVLPIIQKKDKKVKKEKKKKKKKKKESSSDSSSDSEGDSKAKKRVKVKQEPENVKVKKEKHDTGYDKALKDTIGAGKRHYSDSEGSDIDSKYSRNTDQSGRGNRNSDRERDRGYERQRNDNESDRRREPDKSRDFDARRDRSLAVRQDQSTDQRGGRDSVRDRDSDRDQSRQSYRNRSPDRNRDFDRRDRHEDRNDSRDKRGRDSDNRSDLDRSDRSRDRAYRR